MDYYIVHGAGVFVRNMWSNRDDNATLFSNSHRVHGVTPQNAYGAIFLPGIFNLDDLEVCERTHRRHVGYQVKGEFLEIVKSAGMADHYGNGAVLDDDEFLPFFKPYAAMYEPVYAPATETWAKPGPGYAKLIGEYAVENYGDPYSMKVRVHNEDQWRARDSAKVEALNLVDVVSLGQIDAMLTPEFLHPLRPCRLSSKQMFQIVRAFVKENIDLNKAAITSDYDFCFTVKRRQYHAKPKTVRTELKTATGRRYKIPKYKTRTETHVLETIFEMSHAQAHHGGPYTGYTSMPAMEADNLQDMHERLTFYLEHLISTINADAGACPHCEGTGFFEKITPFTNKKV